MTVKGIWKELVQVPGTPSIQCWEYGVCTVDSGLKSMEHSLSTVHCTSTHILEESSFSWQPRRNWTGPSDSWLWSLLSSPSELSVLCYIELMNICVCFLFTNVILVLVYSCTQSMSYSTGEIRKTIYLAVFYPNILLESSSAPDSWATGRHVGLTGWI